MPNPVDTELFYPKPFMHKGKRKRVLIASNSDWNIKGTDLVIRALSMIKDAVDVSLISYGKDFKRTLALAYSLGLVLNVLPKVPHERLNEYYWSADVVIDQFRAGAIGMITLEAIACGRPAVTYISSEHPEYRDFPLKDVRMEEDVANAISRADAKLWQKEYAYMEKKHKPEIVVQKLLRTYSYAVK